MYKKKYLRRNFTILSRVSVILRSFIEYYEKFPKRTHLEIRVEFLIYI